MTAHERYSKFVGEIGINRLEYLYDLTYCDLLMIERGYNCRHMNLWSATRWQTYNLMASFVGGDKLSEHGINEPMDLIRFPWEEQTMLTPEEVEDMQAEIDAINNSFKPPQ